MSMQGPAKPLPLDVVVTMKGRLEYEQGLPFRDHIRSLKVSNPDSTIVLDMQQLDFVGSSGIGSFVETLKLLQKECINLRLTNVKPEFIKVFRLYQLDDLDIMDVSGKKRVFEN